MCLNKHNINGIHSVQMRPVACQKSTRHKSGGQS